MPAPLPLTGDGATRSIGDAGRRNMLQLVQLRWLAVAGQLSAIVIAQYGLGVRLPLQAMLGVAGATILLNLASIVLLRKQIGTSNGSLFFALILDVASLTAQLYLGGGVTNPFISLFLLHVVLGAILLDTWSAVVIVLVTSLCFAFLTVVYRPLAFPLALLDYRRLIETAGAWACFAIIAMLLVLFMTRITQNLRARDAHLANLRQQAAEEDHIVRMGLLASGAAHELGTPLASLAVILGDWKRMPALSADPDLVTEIGEMQAEVQRCKAIVTGVLLAAGEARGEAPAITGMRRFLDGIAEDWHAAHMATTLDYRNDFPGDLPVVADPALKQVLFNVLDNAAEASPGWIGFSASQADDALVIAVRDAGPGFSAERLERIGKPYESSKGRLGGGLGLFLVVNVMRKLGGAVTAANCADGGAVVRLTLPLAAIAAPPGRGA
ncbi:ATP-binding protein [Sphingomonas montana]|uniref:ATP-binding protein n=1 Tax=Sphingomonas montana TaxID=1843236 RepID=UPI00096BFCF7|nr:ATP-binding protein [Sphingomonas montana]